MSPRTRRQIAGKLNQKLRATKKEMSMNGENLVKNGFTRIVAKCENTNVAYERVETKNSISPTKHVDHSSDFKMSCTLCLRAVPKDDIMFSNESQHLNSLDELQRYEKLTNVLSLEQELATIYSICRTCWMLVDMFFDFRQCCSRAESCAKLTFDGLRFQRDTDSWLSRYTTDKIGHIHRAIQKQKELIEIEEGNQVAVVTPESLIKIEVEYSAVGGENDVVNNTEFVESDENIETEMVVLKSESEFYPEDHEPALVDKIEINVITCEKCKRRFDTKSGYKIHDKYCNAQKPNKAIHSCSICSATFTDRRSLEDHINKHNGIKPYSCQQKCGISFYSFQARKSHEKYCGIDKLICSICGIQLSSKGTFQQHILSVHGEAKFGCKTCGRMFKSMKSRNKHMLVHSDERNYQCEVCTKAFKTSYARWVHLRIHTQEKPFACTICDQKFTYNCSLKTHIQRAHGISK
ncbi:zinc finger protein 699-like isoform X2 [Topomyia yanbarensis]|uniref:zinc finger protein 699-like isoform X2 n=1 Tax=Topomyia yanbarensis TaxID=2498891 RepID=UPI00273C3FF7|nr:zinc finger protein 699-like isoform X2 [Topomyia yanbarensis]